VGVGSASVASCAGVGSASVASFLPDDGLSERSELLFVTDSPVGSASEASFLPVGIEFYCLSDRVVFRFLFLFFVLSFFLFSVCLSDRQTDR
jgi:hypothetical protein